MTDHIERVSLDREDWSYRLCPTCKRRKCQLTIDREPGNRDRGRYESYCWQCYWMAARWRRGPIVNCGPMWDGVDVRRQSAT
jgi:hypothetical protein